MYGTTYVMYVCATAFCGSWKSSYIHEGGGEFFWCFVFWASQGIGYRKKHEILLNKKRRRGAWLRKKILTDKKIRSTH